LEAEQDSHRGIEISLKEAQGMETWYTDGTRPFLQKNLNKIAKLQGIAMVESHFCDEGMEFGNAGAVHAGLVITSEDQSRRRR